MRLEFLESIGDIFGWWRISALRFSDDKYIHGEDIKKYALKELKCFSFYKTSNNEIELIDDGKSEGCMYVLRHILVDYEDMFDLLQQSNCMYSKKFVLSLLAEVTQNLSH